MSLVADFSVPAEAFCLAETLSAVPEMTVKLDRLVAHSPDYVMPFLWVLGDEWASFERALADDPTVSEASVTDSFRDARLYQIRWTPVVNERLQVILDHEGVILEARASTGEWRLRMRVGSREHFGEFRAHFERVGPISLHQLTAPNTPGSAHYGTTREQRETLLAAYSAGYFGVPRRATGSDLAEQLAVTQQAVSGRLRRGMAALIESAAEYWLNC